MDMGSYDWWGIWRFGAVVKVFNEMKPSGRNSCGVVEMLLFETTVTFPTFAGPEQAATSRVLQP